MAGKKGGENTKKVAGNARKAEAAVAKQAAEDTKRAAKEDEEWAKGAKNNAKKEADAAKRADVARKKAEKEAQLAEEEKGARPAPKNTKTAVKKTRGLDMAQLDDFGEVGKATPSLNATGIDNALDALSLTAGDDSSKVDRHPERRFKAAYAAYEERRLIEMEQDGSGQGLRLNQKKEKIKKEFEKSPENPFNQTTARFDATKDDIKELKEAEKRKIEQRLAR